MLSFSEPFSTTDYTAHTPTFKTANNATYYTAVLSTYYPAFKTAINAAIQATDA